MPIISVKHILCAFPGLYRTLACASALIIIVTFASARAQTLNARISVASTAPARLRIDVHLPAASKTLSFRNTYAGVLGLGERIESVAGIRENGQSVSLQTIAPGEFQAAERFSRFTYEVKITAPSRPAQMSHVSSLDPERGVLMLSDLLPQATKDPTNFVSAVINLNVPAGWTIASNAKREGSEFSTDDPETAVFLIGPSLHAKTPATECDQS
jgi:hypothetical protein